MAKIPDELIELGGIAIWRRRHDIGDPNWPIGIDKQGYHQEPYVDSIPKWKWEGFHLDAEACLSAAFAKQIEEIDTLWMALIGAKRQRDVFNRMATERQKFLDKAGEIIKERDKRVADLERQVAEITVQLKESVYAVGLTERAMDRLMRRNDRVESELQHELASAEKAVMQWQQLHESRRKDMEDEGGIVAKLRAERDALAKKLLACEEIIQKFTSGEWVLPNKHIMYDDAICDEANDPMRTKPEGM